LTTNRAGQRRTPGQQDQASRAGSASQPAQARPQPRQSRPRQSQPRQPKPLPPGDTLFTPSSSPTRQVIEQRSAAPVLMLHQLPVWLAPVVLVALLVTGLAVRSWLGGIALCAVAAVLGWLAVLSWPRLNSQGRLLRVAVIATVLIAAALHFVRLTH